MGGVAGIRNGLCASTLVLVYLASPPLTAAERKPLTPLAEMTKLSGFSKDRSKVMLATKRCAALHSVVGGALREEGGDETTAQENAEYGAYLAKLVIEAEVGHRAGVPVKKIQSAVVEEVQGYIKDYMLDLRANIERNRTFLSPLFKADMEICKVLPRMVQALPK
ncbi:MAG: hypothetical protein ACO2Z7_05625 [Burkholderiaceae bacterium]|jgi:hypothetical protein|nr:hypothetical protein [Betaproteobacteria bacterium]